MLRTLLVFGASVAYATLANNRRITLGGLGYPYGIREMVKWRQQDYLWVRKIAPLLIFLNLIGAVGFYYAVPAYQAMKHISPGWMTSEIRTALSLINVIGALLILKRYFYVGLTVLFITGTIAFVHALQRHGEYATGFLFSYWDVIVLLTLDAAYRQRSKPA